MGNPAFFLNYSTLILIFIVYLWTARRRDLTSRTLKPHNFLSDPNSMLKFIHKLNTGELLLGYYLMRFGSSRPDRLLSSHFLQL
jgi:hypothetical protein